MRFGADADARATHERAPGDAEVKHTSSGVAVATLSIATNRRWKDSQSGEWKEETDWHRVKLWRCENVAEYLRKGRRVHAHK